MALKTSNHVMTDNVIKLNNKDTVLLGAERVLIGVDTGETEIKTLRDATGKEYYFNGDKIIGKPVYDSQSQKHPGWFVLDLETGSRNWYPGKK